jgi:anaerobic magnesium-protoporphyrin IX monomethyl ester cyclase
MRFLLINPYYPIDETPSPPLGLAFIAAALDQAGCDVRLLDFVVYPYSPAILEKTINNFKPDFVGTTSVTMSFNNAAAVIKDVKQINPDILTVMGGPHVSFHVGETFAALPELDFIIVGEGEQTVVELVNAVQCNMDLKTVKGIGFREKTSVIQTETREFANVDDLPLPERRFVPLGRYRALGMPVSMTSSRGCPFQCIFCVGRKMVGAKVRYRNPKAVVDEMAYLNSLGFHQINLADDLFTANPKHCIAVCDEIIRRNLKVSWTSFARVDTVTEEALVMMREAGCHTVSFGVESGNPEMLKRIKKGITLQQVIDAVALCNKAGIAPHASFILGLPGETPETVKDSVQFGEKLSTMGVQHGFHLLAPFPGTEVRDHITRYDLKIMTDDWSEYHANRAIVETSTVNREMLDEIVIDWEQKYKNYLGTLKELRESGEGTPEEVWPLTRLEHTVLIYDLMMADAIETHGLLDTPGGGDGFSLLVEKIGGLFPKYTIEQWRNTLTFAVDQGYLKCFAADGATRWAWVDYL